MKKKILLIVLCIAGVLTRAQTQTKSSVLQLQIDALIDKGVTFATYNPYKFVEKRTYEDKGVYYSYEVNKNVIKQLYERQHEYIKLWLPMPDGSIEEILLKRNYFLASDFKATYTNENGVHNEFYKSGIYYNGVLVNKSSMAVFSVFENKIFGLFSDEKGNWNLGPKSNTAYYALYCEKELSLPLKFECNALNRNLINEDHMEFKNNNNKILTFPKCTRIFVDCDYELFLNYGTIAAVREYVTNLYNVISTLYGNENMSIAVTSINVWTSTDPFEQGSALLNLQSFGDFYQDAFNGDLAQLLAMDNVGDFGGLAWLDVLCTSFDATNSAGRFSYVDINADFEDFPTYSWDVSSAAHELGHNFGSHHTHWCGWVGGAIDNCNICNAAPGPMPYGFLDCHCCTNPAFCQGCPNLCTEGGCSDGPSPPSSGGTIMSYCHNCFSGIDFLAGFGTQPGNLIRTKVQLAGCLGVCQSDCDSILGIGADIPTGISIVYEASDVIYANNTIETGSSIIYSGENLVVLNDGFEAKFDTYFEATNDGCGFFSTMGKAKLTSISKTGSPYLINKDFIKAMPNPFNNSTEISFEPSDDEFLSLHISDYLGKEIKTLYKGEVTANKKYQFTFSGEGYAPGVYFCVAKGSKTNKVIRLVLFK